ncbi:uncharacterized protein V1516DRAFT_672060 [Lipomyces oligophaga]|uniref:uncharacterized protein n=1 Tax=Lipomyces oligophaga TaxID=45792 RepID=UPI0034CDB550
MAGPLSPVRGSNINNTRPQSRILKDIDVHDLQTLKSSSTGHFRNLAQNVEISNSNLVLSDLSAEAEDVTGMHGRKRFQRNEEKQSYARDWMDQERKSLQAYEYLCHIGEAKDWIEKCLGESIPPVVQLEEALRDGVILAQLTQVFAPQFVGKIFRAARLQWRHSDNIQYFFRFLDEVDMPDLFRFEFTDLYDKKNIPKVIYCIHALSYILSASGLAPSIDNLVGTLEFSDDDIEATRRGLDAAGISMPNFNRMNSHFGDSPASSAPRKSVETEDNRINRQLEQAESNIAKLQAIASGAITRAVIRGLVEELIESKLSVVKLQSHIRAFDYRKQMRLKRDVLLESRRSLADFQSRARAAMTRSSFGQFVKDLTKEEPGIVHIQSRLRGILKRRALDDLIRTDREICTAVGIQSLIRGRLIRQAINEQIHPSLQLQNDILNLQALCRGSMFRMLVHRHEEALSEQERSFIRLQSRIRRLLYISKSEKDRISVTEAQEVIIDLQSRMRGCLLRRQKESILLMLHNKRNIQNLNRLQAISKGKSLRRSFFKQQLVLDSCHVLLDDLRNRIRGSAVRASIVRDCILLADLTEPMRYFQADIRKFIVRQRIRNLIVQLRDSMSATIMLQSETRGALARGKINEDHEILLEAEDKLILLQNHARGLLGRFQYYRDLRSMDESEDISVVPLQSAIRGMLLRDRQLTVIGQLSQFGSDIIELQAFCRGALCRVDLTMFEDELLDEEQSIADLQTLIRGFIERERFRKRQAYFEANMKQVIKFQSVIRAKQQANAYKAITSGINPPLTTVKKFVHLLTDNDLDFEEEIEVEKLRKEVVDEVQHNEQLEQFIDQLDVKIALLVKNKITLDEVIKHQHGGLPRTATVTGMSDPFDLKSLNKTSRRRLELYQGLFFVLQTQPNYLCKLLNSLKDAMVTEKELKSIEHGLMALFGYAQERREEFYMLKLVAKMIEDAISQVSSIPEFVQEVNMWTRMLSLYARGAEKRQYLHELVKPIVNDISEHEDLDLESDPLSIYHTSINQEELTTGKRSARNHDVDVGEAMKDPQSRNIYIRNLQLLREYAVEFMNTFRDNIDSIPYGIRYLARSIFLSFQKQFPSENEDKLFSAVANLLYTRYISGAILAPDVFGRSGIPLSPLQKKNLCQISRIISQICSGKVFSVDNVFLQPLNVNIAEYIKTMRETIRSVIDIPDPEIHFDMDQFGDLTSRRRPTLHIKTSEIHLLHSIIIKYADVFAPEQTDALRKAITELGPLPSTSNEILNNSKLTEVKLDLNPNFINAEDKDAQINSLLTAVKRCILYVIRVQSGSNLLETLVSPVTAENEEKYNSILEEEKKSKAEITYSSDNVLGDLSLLKYRDLKVIALEKIIELKRLGQITQSNNYQDILNAIANDIRTKRNRRIQRQRELKSTKQTLEHLSEKENYLQTKLKNYNEYIERSMSTLQTKKGKRRNIMPFTKQFFHMRELQKHGRVPQFGSFKYSSSKLLEKGVLVGLAGSAERQHIDFTFSCDQVGIFSVEASQGSITLPAGTIEVTLEALLEKQFNNQQSIKLFDNLATFNTNLLLHLIFRKFYRDG